MQPLLQTSTVKQQMFNANIIFFFLYIQGVRKSYLEKKGGRISRICVKKPSLSELARSRCSSIYKYRSVRHRALGRATSEQRLGLLLCLSGPQETNTIMEVPACELKRFYFNLVLIFLTVNNVADSSLSDPWFFMAR